MTGSLGMIVPMFYVLSRFWLCIDFVRMIEEMVEVVIDLLVSGVICR